MSPWTPAGEGGGASRPHRTQQRADCVYPGARDSPCNPSPVTLVGARSSELRFLSAASSFNPTSVTFVWLAAHLRNGNLIGVCFAQALGECDTGHWQQWVDLACFELLGIRWPLCGSGRLDCCARPLGTSRDESRSCGLWLAEAVDGRPRYFEEILRQRPHDCCNLSESGKCAGLCVIGLLDGVSTATVANTSVSESACNESSSGSK